MPALPLLPTLMPRDASANSPSHYIDFEQEYGPGDGVTDYTMAVAEVLTRGQLVKFGEGTWLFDNMVWQAGQNARVEGVGSRTVFQQRTAATGDFIDLSRFASPTNQRGWDTVFSGVRVRGGPSGDRGVVIGKRDPGLVRPTGATFEKFSVEDTVGTALAFDSAYFSTLDDIIVHRPSGPVPWVELVGPNGCRIRGIGLRSSDNTPLSTTGGAFVVRHDGTFNPHDFDMSGCWDEFLHVPEGGCVWEFDGCHTATIQLPQLFDSFPAASGTTSTCHVRFTDTRLGAAYGAGNLITGAAMGRGTGAQSYAYGVELGQSGNSIEATKHYRGYNVRVLAGVSSSSVELSGRESTADWPAFIDDANDASNVLVDKSVATLGYSPGEAGNSTQTDFSFTHNLNTTTPDVKVYVNDGTNTQLRPDVPVLIDDADNVTAQFATAPAATDTVTIRVDA